MLKSIMSPEAWERLARVAIVKPENTRAVEEHLIKLARSGKLKAKVRRSPAVSRFACTVHSRCVLCRKSLKKMYTRLLCARLSRWSIPVQISESDLIQFLDEVAKVTSGGGTKKVTVVRKKRAGDDDEDDDDDDF